MSRQVIRDWKRALRTAPTEDGSGQVLAKEAALSLLARSVEFRHPRLAVVRLAMAVQAGAEVPTPHWDYCRAAMTASRDISLRALFEAAWTRSTRHEAR